MCKIFADFVCMFVWSKAKRHDVRANIRYHRYIKKCMSFVCKLNTDKNCKIKKMFGFGHRNVIFNLNDKYVFKFPLPVDGHICNDLALREKRIYDAFKDISPIKIPSLKLLDFDGVVVRRYECVKNCKPMTGFSPVVINKYRHQIANQIAEFLYVVGKSNPASIADLKPNKNAKPGFMYGWCQNDLGGNFLIDTKTMKVKYFIDWEDTQFISFTNTLYNDSHYWEKRGYRGLAVDVVNAYNKMFFKK